MYRIIISEKSRDTYYKPLEFLGSYNPYNKELKARGDRIKYWLSQGAGMSPTVNNLLISQNVIEGEKVKASKSGNKENEEKASQETEKKGETTEQEGAQKEEVKQEEVQETEKKEPDQEEGAEEEKSE